MHIPFEGNNIKAVINLYDARFLLTILQVKGLFIFFAYY